MEIKTAFDMLKRITLEADAEATKAATGNQSAGTRLRKKMQDVKKAAQAVRDAVLEIRPKGSK